jgi:hypothetical protein
VRSIAVAKVNNPHEKAYYEVSRRKRIKNLCDTS